MKKRTIATLATVGLLPLINFAQTPPTLATPATPAVPTVPGVPAVPPVPGFDRGDHRPKVPVTYLGVETSDVPTVVAEQLGLAKGFGLVVDYVVPDGPAAAAGVQQNDILKMLNDQILMEPDQLSKLIRSYKEGDTVSLTVLRKGAETKLSAKLQKRDVPQRGDRNFMRHPERFGMGEDFNAQMKQFGEEMKNMQLENGERIKETVRNAREQARRAREEARRIAEESRNNARNGVRVITSRDNGALKTTRIDVGRAQIAYSDAQGEMNIEVVNGKRVLTAKDPQGKLLFSGPVDTKEELDKVPADVRQRYEKIEYK
ncbi:MAG: S1C family serine protease, partial [Chthoniobacterales bacterium]